MSILIVNRNRHFYFGILKWRIILDGILIAKVRNGGTSEMTISQGNHELQVWCCAFFDLFRVRWMHSNKLTFSIEPDETIVLNVGYHRLWNIGYRRPQFFQSRESMVLLPENDGKMAEYIRIQERQFESYRLFKKAVHGTKTDIALHIIFLLLFIVVPIVGHIEVDEQSSAWLGMSIISGIALIGFYRYDHELSFFGFAGSVLFLLGFPHSNIFIQLLFLLVMSIFFFRGINRYKKFKQMKKDLIKEDPFYGTFTMRRNPDLDM